MPGDPTPPGTSVVEITLTPDGAATFLRLTHSGLPAEAVEPHTDGWDHFLPRLVIAGAGGDPAAPEPSTTATTRRLKCPDTESLVVKGQRSMQAVDVLRGQLTQAHEMLEFAIDGLSDEQLHYRFPGATIQAAGPIYVHVISNEDLLITTKLRNKEPIYVADGWADKLGIDINDGYLTEEWATSLKITDLVLLQSYAQAVYAASDAYLASITADDLNGTVDFMGEMRIGDYLGRIIVWHAVAHGGEIAAIKGMFGLQGAPW